MKYIRTKAGRIIKVGTPTKEEYERDYENSNVSYEEWFACLCFSLDVVQQANTIEELCDEFILHYDFTVQEIIPIPWATYERRSDNWQKQKEKLIELKKNDNRAIVYGAIWVIDSNGAPILKSVAKMNRAGELELL